MSKTDIIVKIKYNLKEPDETIIETNANEEAVSEILETWLSGQINRGKDDSQCNEKDEFEVVIRLDLSNDTFSTNSDTNNKSVTCGIVIDVFRRLGEIPITDLS